MSPDVDIDEETGVGMGRARGRSGGVWVLPELEMPHVKRTMG